MAYMNQETKARLVKTAKSVLKKYGLHGTFSVQNHSGIVCTINSGPIDFQAALARKESASTWIASTWIGHCSVNVYWIADQWTGTAKDALMELYAALNEGNHDHSDISTDYFEVGWYVYINIGKWDRPYVITQ